MADLKINWIDDAFPDDVAELLMDHYSDADGEIRTLVDFSSSCSTGHRNS